MKLKDLSIRWASQTECEAIISLMEELYRHSNPDGPKQFSRNATFDHITRLIDPATPHRLAIAWSKEGKPIGLAAAAIFLSVNEATEDRQTQMELKELFVSEPCRSAGVGEALMIWIEDYGRSKGVSRFDWHVQSNNTAGTAFYKKLGACTVVDRLSMRKRLK